MDIVKWRMNYVGNTPWVDASREFGKTPDTWRKRYNRRIRSARRANHDRSRFSENISEGRTLNLKQTGNILVMPDTHIPAMHPDAVGFFKRTANLFGCTQFIHIGDVFDLYAGSRWDKAADSLSLEEELDLAAAMAKDLYATFPKVDMVVGNHDRRLFDAEFNTLGIKYTTPLHSFFGMPDTWTLSHEIRLEMLNGDTTYIVHNPGSGGLTPARTAAAKWMVNVVCGHFHSALGTWGVVGRDKTVYGMNVGCMIDEQSYAFDYTGTKKPVAALGCGVIMANGTFIAVPYN